MSKSFWPKISARRWKLLLEIFVFTVVIVIFTAKAGSYFGVEALTPGELFKGPRQAIAGLAERIRQDHRVGSCPENTKEITVNWSYVCRKDTPPNNYVTIFDTYDKLGKGREFIYNDTNRGDIAFAKLLVEENKYDFKRYEPSHIANPTWEEDPYADRYWRFSFYSLQAVDDLVYAYRETGDEKYANKAVDLINSFADHGVNKVHSWDDYHAVAFRTMTLTNAWWKLRQENTLDIDLSNKILALLERHGAFLSDRAHFEANHNHGVNEAAALYLLGTAFPTLRGGEQWRTLGADRIDGTLHDLIDNDGVLIENSPFYHFYVLGKYWEIYRYGQARGDEVSPIFKEKLDKMVNYAVHVLQPNAHAPTIGASLDTEIFYNAEFKDLAREYPELKYVITKSKYGERPPQTNAFFYEAGQAIFRSDFGKNFAKQSQVIFQTSGYRTKHSHLDALSVNITEGNHRLLVDPGLYSYEENPVSSYFESTAAHNTVTVDDKDQRKGESRLMEHSEGDAFASATASHELYEGVTHSRTVSVLDKRTIIVIDKLNSKSNHTYKQFWHFAPGSKVIQEGDTVMKATYPGRKEPMIIRQLQSVDGSYIEENKQGPDVVAGLCSDEYAKLLSCPQGQFTKFGKEVTFVTAIELDTDRREYNFENDQTLHLTTPNASEFTLKMKTVPPVEQQFVREKQGIMPQAPNQARIGLLFTDASSTITSILPITSSLGHKASVALPGRYLENFYSDTLTPHELQEIQEKYGWVMVNNAFERTPILDEQAKATKFNTDIIQGAKSLQKFGLVTNHNWFVYPNGSLSAETKAAVSQNYPFAIQQGNSIASLPFSDPHAVQSFIITDSTPPAKVMAAIDRAVRENKVLLLHFKRIKHSRDISEAGYNIEDFTSILRHLNNAHGLRTMNLSELDNSLGIKASTPTISLGSPGYTKVDTSSKSAGLWDRLRYKLN